MSQQQLLAKVVQALEDSGCQYMITGSFVSSLQGEPRLTHDIDLVVTIPTNAVSSLVEHFPAPEFLLEGESVLEAIRTQTMFNLLHAAEGDKVDFWLLTDDPFDMSRFARRRRENVLGLELLVSSPEDTILAKLRWAKMSGGSEKHFRDALRVYQVHQEALDVNYIRYWVDQLGLKELWSPLLHEA